MNRKTENQILGGIVALFSLYILLRAWLLPVTVDESTTVFNHVSQLVVDMLFFIREADPNNHILNTLLIKTLMGMFGSHHFVVRLPVLIGGFFYAWASVQLVRKLSERSWVRIFALLMLFGNPYMLEFFSLAKGYGLAAGLLTFAIWQAWCFFESNDKKALRRSVLFSALAVYAHFTLLLCFIPLLLILLTGAWQLNPARAAYWKQIKPSLITLGVFTALWIAPLKRLSKNAEPLQSDALGSFFSFIKQAVSAMIHKNQYVGKDSEVTLAWLLLAGAVVMIGIGLWRWWRQGFNYSRDLRVLPVLLLLGVALTNILEVHVFKTPYLQARVSLFYWPLFALTLGCNAGWLAERFGLKKTWIFMAPLLALVLINNIRTVNLRSSYEWYADSDTFTILEYLKKTYEQEGRQQPIILDTEWFMQNSFQFHLELEKTGYEKYVKMVPYHGRQTPQKDSDFLYVVNFDLVKDVIDAYDVVLRVPNSSLVLLRKK